MENLDLREFGILEFLHSIIDLRGFKEGDSSVLDCNENLLYILENLVLQVKEIAHFQTMVSACAESTESETSQEFEPDPFGYFVPPSCSKRELEVYLSEENSKKTQKILCALISAFKEVLLMYDKKNGHLLKSPYESLRTRLKITSTDSLDRVAVQSPRVQPVENIDETGSDSETPAAASTNHETVPGEQCEPEIPVVELCSPDPQVEASTVEETELCTEQVEQSQQEGCYGDSHEGYNVPEELTIDEEIPVVELCSPDPQVESSTGEETEFCTEQVEQSQQEGCYGDSYEGYNMPEELTIDEEIPVVELCSPDPQVESSTVEETEFCAEQVEQSQLEASCSGNFPEGYYMPEELTVDEGCYGDSHEGYNMPEELAVDEGCYGDSHEGYTMPQELTIDEGSCGDSQQCYNMPEEETIGEGSCGDSHQCYNMPEEETTGEGYCGDSHQRDNMPEEITIVKEIVTIDLSETDNIPEEGLQEDSDANLIQFMEYDGKQMEKDNSEYSSKFLSKPFEEITKKSTLSEKPKKKRKRTAKLQEEPKQFSEKYISKDIPKSLPKQLHQISEPSTSPEMPQKKKRGRRKTIKKSSEGSKQLPEKPKPSPGGSISEVSFESVSEDLKDTSEPSTSSGGPGKKRVIRKKKPKQPSEGPKQTSHCFKQSSDVSKELPKEPKQLSDRYISEFSFKTVSEELNDLREQSTLSEEPRKKRIIRKKPKQPSEGPKQTTDAFIQSSDGSKQLQKEPKQLSDRYASEDSLPFSQQLKDISASSISIEGPKKKRRRVDSNQSSEGLKQTSDGFKILTTQQKDISEVLSKFVPEELKGISEPSAPSEGPKKKRTRRRKMPKQPSEGSKQFPIEPKQLSDQSTSKDSLMPFSEQLQDISEPSTSSERPKKKRIKKRVKPKQSSEVPKQTPEDPKVLTTRQKDISEVLPKFVPEQLKGICEPSTSFEGPIMKRIIRREMPEQPSEVSEQLRKETKQLSDRSTSKDSLMPFSEQLKDISEPSTSSERPKKKRIKKRVKPKQSSEVPKQTPEDPKVLTTRQKDISEVLPKFVPEQLKGICEPSTSFEGPIMKRIIRREMPEQPSEVSEQLRKETKQLSDRYVSEPSTSLERPKKKRIKRRVKPKQSSEGTKQTSEGLKFWTAQQKDISEVLSKSVPEKLRDISEPSTSSEGPRKKKIRRRKMSKQPSERSKQLPKATKQLSDRDISKDSAKSITDQLKEVIIPSFSLEEAKKKRKRKLLEQPPEGPQPSTSSEEPQLKKRRTRDNSKKLQTEPKQSRDRCNFYNVRRLLYKFIKHALRALAIFTDPDIECCFTGADLSNEVHCAKNLALMFIVGPIDRNTEIFPDILPVIFECLDKSLLVKVFTNYLLGHRSTSELFTKILLEHFSNITSLEVVANHTTPSKKINTVIALLKDMLQSLFLFPENIGKCHSEYLDKVIMNCLQLIPVASDPKQFLNILKMVYSAMFRKKKELHCNSLCSLLSRVFQVFDTWLQTPVANKTWVMILDTILSISNSVTAKSMEILLPNVETMCKCITFCIKENEELCLKALEMFEQFLQSFNLSYLPIKEDLLNALYSAMQRPEREINDKVFTVLGKLGSFNRNNFKYAHELKETECSSFPLSFSLVYTGHWSKLPYICEIPLTKYPFDVAYNIITNPVEDLERKKCCWIFVKKFLKIQMKIASQLSNNPGYLTNIADGYCIIHKRALSTMFFAVSVECVSEDAKAFRDQLILTYLVYSHIYIKDPRNYLFLLLLEAAFETLSATVTDSKENVDISVVIAIMDPVKEFDEFYTFPVFEHIVSYAIGLCYKENWEAKYAGCKTINYINNVVTDYEWKMNHIREFIDPLLYSFADCNGKLAFGTHREPIKTLKCILRFVPRYVESYTSEKRKKVLLDICHHLTQSLFSPDYFVRQEVRSILNDLAKSCKIPVSDVVSFSYELLLEPTFVVRCFEDFEFSAKFMQGFTCEDVLAEDNRKVYNALKSIWNNSENTVLDQVPYSMISNDVNELCGALNSLCFYFTKDCTVEEIFQIYIRVLRSSIKKLAEAAVKCLKYILTKTNTLENIFVDIVLCWASSLFGSMNLKQLNRDTLQELLYFRQIFPHSPEGPFFLLLYKHFMYIKAELKNYLCIGKQNIQTISNILEKMHIIIEIMNTFTNWQHKIKRKIIKQVLSLATDFMGYEELIPISKLKGPLLKFCRLHHYEAWLLELHQKKRSMLFEELVNFKNDTYKGKRYYEVLLNLSKPNDVFEMLQYTLKNTPLFFNKKDQTLAKYLLHFHYTRYYTYLKSGSELSLKTFIFIKESKILVKCLTFSFMYMLQNVDIIFELMTVFAFPFASHFQALKDYILNTIAKRCTSLWFENCFHRFRYIFLLDKHHPAEAEILEYIIIPSFFHVIKKEKCQHFFKMDRNTAQASVLESFYACAFNLTKHNRKTQAAFMKLAVMFAEQMHQMDDDTKKFFIIMLKSTSKAVVLQKNFPQNILLCNQLQLLLATMEVNHPSLEDESKAIFFKECFPDFMTMKEKEASLLKKFFYLYAKNLPLNERLPRTIPNNQYLDSLLNVVLAFKEDFYSVAHIFLRSYMDFEILKKWIPPFQDYKHISKVIDLIEVFIYPERETMYIEFDENEISWIVNILLQHLLSKKFSEKCYSILKKIFEENIFANQIYFESWLPIHLLNVAEQPEIYEKCEIFNLMIEVLDNLPVPVLGSFVMHLRKCISFYVNSAAEITPSLVKVLEHVSKFLSKLTKKYPPDSTVVAHSEELEKLYTLIRQLSVSDVTLPKAILLEAVGPCLYLCTKEYIASHVGKMFEYYLENPDIFMRIKALIVWLQILKKDEVFFEISESDRRILLNTFFPAIDRSTIMRTDIMVEIVTVVYLFVMHLRHKKKQSSPSQPKRKKESVPTIVYEVFAVLAKITSKVDSHFPNNHKINAKLSDALLIFREDYGDTLQSLQPDNFEDLQEAFIENDGHLKSLFKSKLSQFTSRLLYKPPTHYTNRVKFFKQIVTQIQPNITIDAVLKNIFENRYGLTISKSYIAWCINFIVLLVTKVFVVPKNEIAGTHFFKCQSVGLLSSLAYLCYEDALLAEHIWMQLFPAVWKMLENVGMTMFILDNNITKKYIKAISSSECNIIPNPCDVFINGAVQANYNFCLYVDKKLIQRSYSFQIIASELIGKNLFRNLSLEDCNDHNDDDDCEVKNILNESQLVEKNVFQNLSSKDRDDFINILNEIYTNLEESDLYYCFNQSYAQHKPETILAMTKYQDVDIFESKRLFKDLVTNATSKNSPERIFCQKQYEKCYTELTKWDFFSQIKDSLFLRDIKIFSKWNIEEGSPTTTLKLLNAFPKFLNVNDSWKDRVASKCQETMKVLPQFYNRRYYSLLELTQEITQLTEAWNVQFAKFENALESSKMIESVYSKWKERSYLLSDCYQFLTESYHIRLGFLKLFEAKINDPKLDRTSRSTFKNMNFSTKHEINESLISLSNVALFHRNIHFTTIKYDETYSKKNLLNLILLKSSFLLNDARPSPNSTFAVQDKVAEKLSHISYIGLLHSDSTNKDEIDAYQQNIVQRTGLKDYNWNLFPEKCKNAALLVLHADMLEKHCNPRENMKQVSDLMDCLIRSCKYGSALNAIKLMPRILRLLDYEDKEHLLPKVLAKYIIPVQYWLPFLPWLVSHLLKAPGVKRIKPGVKRCVLSTVFSHLLEDIGKKFPQEVFFAINSFKEKYPIITSAEPTHDAGESGGRRIINAQWNKKSKERCEEIITSLKNVYPSLINHLEGFIRDFKIFKPTSDEINLTVIKDISDDVFCALYENVKKEDGNTINCSPEFTLYIRNKLKLYFDEKDPYDTSSIYNSSDSCTFASVFSALQRLMKKYIQQSLSNRKSFYLGHNQKFLTNFHHFNDDKINVFGQSPSRNHFSPVKIMKFLPKVEIQNWGEHCAYKISVLGNNGKIYSFLLREETCKVESMKRTKCLQMLNNLNVLMSSNIECVKRFFNFDFPTMISIDPSMILVPYQQQVLYQDIVMYQDKIRGSSPHLYFIELLLEHPNAFENADNILSLIKKAHKDVDKFCLERLIADLYPNSMDFYSFKKEFIKHLSMLIAAEYFLNISMKNELLVYKKSGVLSVFNPRLNLKEVQNSSLLITPNICEFIGPLGMKLITENVYWIASFFKENKNVIDAYLSCLIWDYHSMTNEPLYHSRELILNKLDDFNRKDIAQFMELSEFTVASCQTNPMMQPFF